MLISIKLSNAKRSFLWQTAPDFAVSFQSLASRLSAPFVDLWNSQFLPFTCMSGPAVRPFTLFCLLLF